MSVRQLVWNALTTDPLVMEKVPVERFFVFSSAGVLGREPIPQTQDGLWAIAVWGTNVPPPFPDANVTTRSLRVSVYDAPGSMLEIEEALLRVRRRLVSSPPLRDALSVVFDVAWTDDTEDLFDDTYNAVFRTSTFQIRGTGER